MFEAEALSLRMKADCSTKVLELSKSGMLRDHFLKQTFNIYEEESAKKAEAERLTKELKHYLSLCQQQA